MAFQRIFILPFLKNNLLGKRVLVKPLIPNFTLVANCLNAAFYLSHDIRRDTLVFLLFKEKGIGNLCLKFVGKDLRRLQPDEHSILGLIKNSITKFKDLAKTLEKDQEVQVYSGLFAFRCSLSELLFKLNNIGYQILYPSRKGIDLRNVYFSQKIAYILASESLMDEASRKVVCTNGVAVHFGGDLPRADIQIILLHNELDRLETKRLSSSL